MRSIRTMAGFLAILLCSVVFAVANPPPTQVQADRAVTKHSVTAPATVGNVQSVNEATMLTRSCLDLKTFDVTASDTRADIQEITLPGYPERQSYRFEPPFEQEALQMPTAPVITLDKPPISLRL